MVFSMCITPPYEDWNRYYLSSSDYTTDFSAGEKASFLVRLTKSYGTSSDMITTTFVIRNSDGKFVSVSSQQRTWTDMWYRNYCELDIPSIPDVPGNYTIDVFFNGAAVASQAFTVN